MTRVTACSDLHIEDNGKGCVLISRGGALSALDDMSDTHILAKRKRNGNTSVIFVVLYDAVRKRKDRISLIELHSWLHGSYTCLTCDRIVIGMRSESAK